VTVRSLRRGTIAASRVSAPATVTALSLPGTAGNYAKASDLVVIGDIDIRTKVAATDWTPATDQIVVAKWPSAGLDRAFRLRLDATGFICAFSITGTTLLTTAVATGFTDGTPGWIRVTRVASTGVWEQFKSSDGSSWTSLNSGTLAAGDLQDTTQPLAVGGYSNDGGTPFIGTIHYAEFRVGGTIVAKFDPSAVTILGTRNPTTVVASTGETWTVNGSVWNWVSV
jgi:hypothetical protein